MSTGVSAVRFTYADYINLPEESRYEILDGDLLMSPSPTTAHQRLVVRFLEKLREWARSTRAGEVFVAPLDVILSDTDIVQPDVFFVSNERSAIVKERVFGAPDLIVEVLSPGTENRDRTAKAKIYARAGVKELWLVDPNAKTVEILVNGASGFQRHAFAGPGEAATSATLSGLSIAADAVFGK